MARLRVDFSELHRCVEQMGTAPVDFTVDIVQRPIDPVDIALREGLEISLEDISYDGGLLSYEGRQILLYIKDHGNGVGAALEDGKKGRRFHVADCKTLAQMRSRNRFDRYFVTNNLSGKFEITGVDPYTRRKLSGMARLWVCQNCLKKLNYKGFVSGATEPRNMIWKNFSIDEFFKRYSSCFKYLPHHAEDDDAQYTEDWALIAGRTKAERDFRCEQCGVQLTDHKNLLHVHHINGHKSDNRPSNLKVLCADCHRKQARHEHMFVSHGQMQLINRLRREQGIGLKGAWEEVLEIVDPAVDGVVRLCQSRGLPVPDVGYELQNEDGEVVGEAELAWPDYWLAVVLSPEDKSMAEGEGWQAWEMIEVLDWPEQFAERFVC